MLHGRVSRVCTGCEASAVTTAVLCDCVCGRRSRGVAAAGRETDNSTSASAPTSARPRPACRAFTASLMASPLRARVRGAAQREVDAARPAWARHIRPAECASAKKVYQEWYGVTRAWKTLDPHRGRLS